MVHVKNTDKPVIFITMGDPSGIGPEVMMKAMASPEIRGLAIFALVGDPGAISRAAGGVFGEDIRVFGPDQDDIKLDDTPVNVIDPGPGGTVFQPGVPVREGAAKSLAALKAAVGFMREPGADYSRALVTAPLSKEKVAEVHPGFIGHTEYLQEAYDVPFVTMAFVGQNLKVVPVTRHVPIRDVASCLTAERLRNTIRQVIDNRKVLCGRDDVLIGVSGLNPHNGENGRIGAEEIELIAPVVEEFRKIYPRIEGPIPADVIFYKALRGKIDVAIAMYHDQCLSAFKMVDFDTGVNMTLGLGQVRTSPDHGTAFDIAGKGIADPGSMINAIKLAVRAVSQS